MLRKDGTLELTVTEENDGDGWNAAEDTYGFVIKVSGDTAECYFWEMEDGEKVQDKYSTTFTKGSNTLDAYAGTWGAYWIDWSDTTHSYYEYIVIEEDGTYIYWKLDEEGSATSNSQKGTCTDVTDNTLTLTAKYWYDSSKSDWDTSTGDPYGLYMEVDKDGESASVTAMGWEEDKGKFTRKPSDN